MDLEQTAIARLRMAVAVTYFDKYIKGVKL